MDNKLPRIYVQKQNKKINNNKEFFYGNGKSEVVNNKDNKVNVIKKLNLIFSKYAYKYNLLIKTANGESKEIVILKTKDCLLTIDNKAILIDSIIDVTELHS